MWYPLLNWLCVYKKLIQTILPFSMSKSKWYNSFFDHTLHGDYLDRMFDTLCVKCYVFYAPIDTEYDYMCTE